MAYKLKVKDKIYDLKDGFTIKEELNETLDSVAGIEFETFHEEFVGVPFDHAVIYDTNEKIEDKHFLVDTYDDEVYSFESDMEQNNHHYIVNLFSETKDLERTTLSSLTVTQPTSEGATKTTVVDVLNKVKECYIPIYKKYVSTGDLHYGYYKKFLYSNNLLSKFGNVVCPEFQWNNPTLREVLNDLLSTDDCIPVLKQGIISYYSFKEKGNPIDTTKLSYSKRTMSSGDFVGELHLNMKNAIGKKSTTACEYITLQAPAGSGTLTTENGVIKTQKPVYSIKKLIVYGYSGSRYFHKLDITDRVKEYEDWETLSNVKINGSNYIDLPSWTDSNGCVKKEHKAHYLYFKRGENGVFNMTNKYAAVGTDQNFMQSVVSYTFLNVFHNSSSAFPNDNDRDVFFYIEYETINEEQPLIVGKYLPSPHPENRVFDAQKDSYVDLQHQSIFEYAKVERLGNKIREVYGEYFDESDIPQLGDYIGDEILFSKQVTYFDGILLFKGYLTPHYVLKDYYTGVLSKKRSWEIAKDSEALTRNDVYKLYIESSFVEKTDYSYLDNPLRIYRAANNNDNMVAKFLTSLTDYNANLNICHAFVRTEDGTNDYPINNALDGIVLDLLVEAQGNSLTFNFGFNDNFKAAEYITKEDDEYVQSFYKYCSSDKGYFKNARIFLIGHTYGIGRSDGSSLNPSYYDMPEAIEDNPSAPQYSSDWVENSIEWMFDNPKMGQSAALFDNDGIELSTHVLKDNREIIKWTVQFEYCSDTADIILSNDFIKYCSILNEKSTNESRGKLYLAFAPVDFKYSLGDEIANDDVALVDLSLSSTNLTLSQPASGNKYSMKASWNDSIDTEELEYGAWAVCYYDENSNLRILMAVNKDSNVPVYFNMLRSRDTKVYMDSWSQTVAGDISDIAHITPVQSNSGNRTVRVLRRIESANDEPINESE